MRLDEFMKIYNEIKPDVNGCKIWPLNLWESGYGYVRVIGFKSSRANRVALEIKLGRPIAKEHLSCHTCDVKSCVAQEHLYEGTHAQNMYDAVARGRTAWGDKNSFRKYPEKVLRGENSVFKKHPEFIKRGDEHWMKKRPDRVLRGPYHWAYTQGTEAYHRGDNHYARTNPELLARGSKHGIAKLKESDILDIREMYARGGITHKQIADLYGMSKQPITAIINRKAWKHVL